MLRLHDTRTGRAEPAGGARRGELRIYSCGPILRRPAHVGDLRDLLLPDLIRRAAELGGLHVTAARGGASADIPAEAVRAREEALRADLATLNIRPPEHSVGAAESVSATIDVITSLIEAGQARVAGDGSVFFTDRSVPGDSGAAADRELWRGTAAAHEPARAAPWGRGFPTRDVSCAATSLRCLGDVIDVHTGGTGVRFPHQENERALADAMAGHQVVQRWVHSEQASWDGHVITTDADAPTLRDLAGHDLEPLALRLAFLEVSYRQPVDVGWDVIQAASKDLRHWREQVARWAGEPSAPMSRRHVTAILTAVADDLDTPAALGHLRDLEIDPAAAPGAKFETFAYADRLLGLDLAADVGRSWR